jgi:hypothetical protein
MPSSSRDYPQQAVSQSIEANMRRSEELVACQEELERTQKRLEHLQSELKRTMTLTALREIGPDAWHSLSYTEQRKKINLLTVLEHDSSTLVCCLRGPWDNDTFSTRLRDDRDLVLARVRRKGFATYNRGFLIPNSLRRDKEVVLATVQACPWVLVLQDLPAHFYQDVDVLEALCTSQESSVGGQYGRDKCLKRFSRELRSQASWMLIALQNGIKVWEALPQTLRSNRDFCLDAAAILLANASAEDNTNNYGTKCLNAFSQRLKADPEVVRAFCQADATSLAVASYALRRNLEIVQTACATDPTALVYCLKGKTRTRLIRDKQFWLDTLLKKNNNNDDNNTASSSRSEQLWERLWRLVPPNLQADRELALAFLESAPAGSISVFMVPEELHNDKPFLLEVCRLGKLDWLPHCACCGDVTVDLDPDFGRALLTCEFVEPDIVDSIVSQFPELWQDRRFWETLHPVQYEEVWEDLMDHMPTRFRDEKDIMLRFCTSESAMEAVVSILGNDGSQLLHDREIVEALLETDPIQVLSCFPEFVQMEFPDLVAKSIENSEDLDYLEEIICDELWLNRDIALAWIRRGGLDDGDSIMVEYFFNDEEIFLAIAEHSYELFHFASERLRCDKVFLLEAVVANGKVWTELNEEMKNDFEITLAAFAGAPNLPYFCFSQDNGQMIQFARTVRDKLSHHDTFVKLIIGSIDAASGSTFFRLNQGRDTSLVYKRQIAECLGIAMGDELKLLRQASANLAKWGF